MPTHDTRWIMELDRGAHLNLTLRPGTTLCCRSGYVWLTEYRPGKDVILAAGECHLVSHGGAVVISSRHRAQIAVCPVDSLSMHTTLSAFVENLADLRIRLQLGGEVEKG